MTKHLSDIDLEAYRNRTAPPEQLLAINDHLAECDDCYGRSESRDHLLGDVSRAIRRNLEGVLQEQVEHPDYELLTGYVDGTLKEEDYKTLSAHIESCQECRNDAGEMRAVKARIEVESAAGGGSAPSPAMAAERRMTRWKRLVAFFRAPGYRIAFELTCFILLIAATLWVAANRSRQQIAGLEGRVNQLEQANESLKRQAEESDRLREQLARLERGEHPQPGPTEALKDGNYQVRLDQKGELLGLAALPIGYHALVKDALASGAVFMPAAPTTGMGRVGTLLGAAPQKENFELIFPIGTTVEDARPTFAWQTLPGAGGYTIFVRDTASGAEIEGQVGARPGWQPERQLVRGHVYAWMVEANLDGRRVRAPAPNKPFASFKVLDAQTAREINLARTSWSGSHLLMGLLYARAGLRSEAEKEFRNLAAANPDSETARRLLSRVAAKHE